MEVRKLLFIGGPIDGHMEERAGEPPPYYTAIWHSQWNLASTRDMSVPDMVPTFEYVRMPNYFSETYLYAPVRNTAQWVMEQLINHYGRVHSDVR